MSETVEERGVIPKLRFPGFTEPWKRAQISSTLAILKGRGISKAEIARDGLLPCIRYGELYTQYGNLIGDVFSRTNVPATELLLSVAGDVIIPSSGETKEDIATAACVLNSGVALGGDLSVLRGETDGRWLSYYVNGRLKSAFAKVAQGDSVVHLYPDQIGRVVFAVPSKTEQQSIGQCLESLDELLAAETEKLEALKRHKKGLLQQLLPAEGETTPRLRFPQFRNSADWNMRRVDELFKVTRGEVLAMPLVDENPSTDKPYPVFSSQTKRDGLAGYYSRFLYADAITWTTDGANAGEVRYRGGNFFCTNVCGVLLSKDGFANECVATLLNSVSRAHVSYVGNPKLMNNVMASIEIAIPSLSEQLAISSLLQDIDSVVRAAETRSALHRTHKAALMQQLFPSLDEVDV